MNSVGDEYVGWNPRNRSAFYFSKVKEKGGVFEGYQWVIFDERRLIAHNRAIDIPLVSPSGQVVFGTTAGSAYVEIKLPEKGAKFEPPAGAKFDWDAIGKEAKVFVTVATFPIKAGKPQPRDPKDPVAAAHASRRAVWEPFKMSLVTTAASTEFSTTPPAK